MLQVNQEEREANATRTELGQQLAGEALQRHRAESSAQRKLATLQADLHRQGAALAGEVDTVKDTFHGVRELGATNLRLEKETKKKNIQVRSAQ